MDQNAGHLWLNDIPRTTFQRRVLAFIEEGDDLTAVVAWQDIVRVDIEGIWLEVLAVESSHQHAGQGRQAYDLTVAHLRTIEREGDHIAGSVRHRGLRLAGGLASQSTSRRCSSTVPMASAAAT